MTAPVPQSSMEIATEIVADARDPKNKVMSLGVAISLSMLETRIAAALDAAREQGRFEGAYWGLGIATQSRDYIKVGVAAGKILDPDEGWNSFILDTEAGREFVDMLKQSGAIRALDTPAQPSDTKGGGE